jgi:hypothetical protein
MEESLSSPERDTSLVMSPGAIIGHLQRQGLQHIKDYAEFTKSSRPLLCVLPLEVRDDKGPFQDIKPRSKRPCVARVHNPKEFRMPNPDLWLIVNGGQVDYFTLLPDGTPEPVNYSSEKIGKEYVGQPTFWFEADDKLFPKRVIKKT